MRYLRRRYARHRGGQSRGGEGAKDKEWETAEGVMVDFKNRVPELIFRSLGNRAGTLLGSDTTDSQYLPGIPTEYFVF